MASIQAKQENELQTRSRIITNYMKDRDNCIVLKMDTLMSGEKGISPFGFHFDMDKNKYKQNKKRLRRQEITRWLSWIAYYHHKFGIRHIFLVACLAAYVFIGGAVFNALESPTEISDLKHTIVLMQGIIKEMSHDVIDLAETYNGTNRVDRMGKMIKRYYKTMLEAEGRFHGSVWHKAENLEMHLMWYYSSATFYAMTLFTTIGYGTISPQTWWGKAISIVYSALGIPLMLVVLGDVGEWFQKLLTKAYVWTVFQYKKFRNLPPPENPEEIFLPMTIAIPIVLLYLLLCTTVIKGFDHDEGHKPGIDFGSAFYFTFISLTTIGLGDVMPYNIQYSPFLAGAFLLGLALVSIVNTSIYAQMYDDFFRLIAYMERELDRIHREHFHVPGHKIFQDMQPAVRLLVLSFPHSNHALIDRKKTIESIDRAFAARAEDEMVEKGEEKEKEEKKEQRYVKKKKTVQIAPLPLDHLAVPSSDRPRSRTASDLAAHDAEHRPKGEEEEEGERMRTGSEQLEMARKAEQRRKSPPRRRAPTLGALGGWEVGGRRGVVRKGSHKN